MKLPASVGVPLNTPVVERVMPGGKGLDARSTARYVSVNIASKLYEKARPSETTGKLCMTHTGIFSTDILKTCDAVAFTAVPVAVTVKVKYLANVGVPIKDTMTVVVPTLDTDSPVGITPDVTAYVTALVAVNTTGMIDIARATNVDAPAVGSIHTGNGTVVKLKGRSTKIAGEVVLRARTVKL